VRVLLIENRKALLSFLKEALAAEGFAVDVAEDAAEGDFKVRTAEYDVAMLEPEVFQDGMHVVQDWRRQGRTVPVLVINGSASVAEKVKSLDTGADDYLAKPFQLEELVARLRALIRRGYGLKSPTIRIHGLEIDTTSRTVRRGKRLIPLTQREFALLQFLAYHQGRVVSRSMIWEHLYNEQTETSSNVVEVFVRNLRKKIDPRLGPSVIQTRWGQGYMLRPEAQEKKVVAIASARWKAG
jgi:DNA-binding response OmpR family regulator